MCVCKRTAGPYSILIVYIYVYIYINSSVIEDLRRFPNHLFMLTPGNTDWGYTV